MTTLTSSARALPIAPEQKELLAEFVRAKRASAFVEKNKGAVLSILESIGGQATLLNALIYQGESVSYQYPAMIKRREEQLKKDKEIMQLNGRANKVTKPCVKFEDLRKAER